MVEGALYIQYWARTRASSNRPSEFAWPLRHQIRGAHWLSIKSVAMPHACLDLGISSCYPTTSLSTSWDWTP